MNRQHIIVCEGYDDRSFWAGLLLRLGLRDPSAGLGPGRRPKIYDPWKAQVAGGQFAFYTANNSFVRLQPCDGGDGVFRAAEAYLNGHPTKPIGRMIINIDADRDAGADTGPDAGAAVRDFMIRRGGQLLQDGTGTIGEVRVIPVIWSCVDAPNTAGVPNKQTLERLVCAAVAAAHPDRTAVVDRWLAEPPRAEPVTHKHYSLSYLAKWYAEHGADDFLRELWREPHVAAELEKRLVVGGSWQHLLAFAAD